MKTDKNNSITHTQYWSYSNFEKKRYSTNFSLRVMNFLKKLINEDFLKKFGFSEVAKAIEFQN